MAVNMQKLYTFEYNIQTTPMQAHGLYNKGIIHVQKFYAFDCYDILPALKQEVQFDAHEFHLALVSSLMSKL